MSNKKNQKYLFVSIISLALLMGIVLTYKNQVAFENATAKNKQSEAIDTRNADSITVSSEAESSEQISSENHVIDENTGNESENYDISEIVENQGFSYKINSLEKSKVLKKSYNKEELPLREDDIINTENTLETGKQFLYIDMTIQNISGKVKEINIGCHKVFCKSNIYEIYAITNSVNPNSKNYFNFILQPDEELRTTFLYAIKDEDIDNENLRLRLDMNGSYSIEYIPSKYFSLNKGEVPINDTDD